MLSQQTLLSAERLVIGFPTRSGAALAANQVSLSARPGSTLGLVGESGCGKSVTLRSFIGMVPTPGEVLAGSILWNGRDVTEFSDREWRNIRGREISMIFQDPTSSLNPVHTVGSQLAEFCRIHLGLARRDASIRAVELLREVGIPSAGRRARSYPHQLSGGMRQRVMIAMAVAASPQLLLADEPTTSLDVTVQDQILSLIRRIQDESGMAMILVSHDLGVISQTCEDIVVMYAGYVVERGSRVDIIQAPRHPYTQALLAAELMITGGKKRLHPIGGAPPNLAHLPPGCPFQARCQYARPACAEVTMELDQPMGGHASACPIVDIAS